MKVLELDFRQLPLLVKIRGRAESKYYLLKSPKRKLAACLAGIDKPLEELLT